jgi:copper chaperone CopZ
LDGVWYTLERIEGISKYTVDYDRNDERFKATVTFDDTKTTIEKITETLTRAGYPLQEKGTSLNK